MAKRPFDRVLVCDFESSWGRAVKLGFSCQTMEEYLRDPRFKAWGMSWKELDSDAPVQWVTRKDLPAFFASIDWSRTAVMAQNAAFDVSIMAWHYDVHPAFVFDTLSMGRALRGVEVGNSLKKLAEDLGLPPKGDGLSPSENILDELPPDVEKVLAEYCCHDTWLCEQIFFGLGGFSYPVKELRLIDLTMKMYTRPLIELDAKMLEDAIGEEKTKREGLLKRLDVQEVALASNDQFAEVLRGMGVEPPTKKSKTTGKEAFAFAKNDALFQALINHDNEDIALLCEARLKVKSTTERTRAQRFLDISTRGRLPVPLTYFGAGTGRWTASKGSAINMQNLKRGSFLRKALLAPKEYVFGVGDLSQIEPRVLAWFADYQELLDIFASGVDAYSVFGGQMFNVPGMTKESHPILRQSAKSALLGCGFGLGWASFATQLLVGFLGAPPVRYTKAQARSMGVTQEHIRSFIANEEWLARMFEIPHTCTDEELLIHCVAAKLIIDKYRSNAWLVKEFWSLCESMIERCLMDGDEYTLKGCVTFRKGEIVLPSGMPIHYNGLRRERDEKTKQWQWVYGEGKNKTNLYGGKITNNIVQGTARVIMTDGMLRISDRHPVVGQVHDEVIALLPERVAQEEQKWLCDQMIVPPKYMPGIPLAVGGGFHKRYGLAKD